MDYQYLYTYDKGPTLTPVQNTKLKRVKLDLPSGFDKFNFYSNNRNGRYDIIEGSSGVAVTIENKSLSFAKEYAAIQIKERAKTPSGLQEIINTAINNAVKKLKESKVKIPADYLARAKQEKIVRISPAKKEVKYSAKLDKLRQAEAPGKRKAGKDAKKPYYYEYRKNRTDKPGTKL